MVGTEDGCLRSTATIRRFKCLKVAIEVLERHQQRIIRPPACLNLDEHCVGGIETYLKHRGEQGEFGGQVVGNLWGGRTGLFRSRLAVVG